MTSTLKNCCILFLPILALCFCLSSGVAAPLGTAFNYQGRLVSGTNAANGSFDIKSSLFDAPTAGIQIGASQTNSAIAVSNGLFSVGLDFGGSAFDGAGRWLELGVRSNSSGAFVILTPRQPLTPTPYALSASNLSGTVSASQLSGTVASGQLAGTYSGPFNLNNAANSFSGNGANLIGVNAATLGGLSASNFWKLQGNSGTAASANFLGTTDNQALELKVNGERAFRLEPANYDAPNVIGGSASNFVSSGFIGSTISGGGAGSGVGNASNSISADFSTVGGGYGNTVGLFASVGTVAGGSGNTISGAYGTVGGGFGNTSKLNATVGGGYRNNSIGDESTIGGGIANTAYDQSTVGGGGGNTSSGGYATVGGGSGNQSSGYLSTVGGGNQNTSSGNRSTISGGSDNVADSFASTVNGGSSNSVLQSDFGTIAGGNANGLGIYGNGRGSAYSAIGGGSRNFIGDTPYCTIAGGTANLIGAGVAATIGGGTNNQILESLAGTIGGGSANWISSRLATIAGGEGNTILGDDEGQSPHSSIGGGWANRIAQLAQGSTISGGVQNQIAGGFPFSGWASIGGGTSNLVSAPLATIPGGAQAKASNYGQMAYASGNFTTSGDAQTSTYVCRGTTTNANLTELFLDGAGQRLTVATNSTWTFDVLVTGRTAGGNSAGYQIRGVIKNIGGVATIVGSPTFTLLAEDVSAWDASVAALNQALSIRVNGFGGATIRWVATVRTAEVIF
jgi:hypothetical protein